MQAVKETIPLKFTSINDKLSVRRTFNIFEVNGILNQVYNKKLDASECLIDENNIVLMFDGGCFVLSYLEQGIYEVHSQAIKSSRGKKTLKAVIDGFRYMFLHTPCMEILTKVPDGNKAALGLTRLAGFKFEFRREKSHMNDDGVLVDCDYYALRYYDWVKNEKWLDQFGEQFHVFLGDNKNHDDDEAHDRYVGAALQMIKNSQVDKGIILYNRWARFAGYVPIILVSREPLIIDIGTDMLEIDKDGVSLCQQLQQQE